VGMIGLVVRVSAIFAFSTVCCATMPLGVFYGPGLSVVFGVVCGTILPIYYASKLIQLC